MRPAYRLRRSWEARSDRERTTWLVFVACLLYTALTLAADIVLPAVEGLP